MAAGRQGSGEAPSGTFTFLFSDIEGSTRRWQADRQAMAAALATHDRVLRAIVEAHGGRVFKNTGDGACAVFASAAAAVRAAVDAQRALTLPVRMAVHTGEAIERDGDYFGVTLSRCARLVDAGHDGQVLVSAAAAAVASDSLEDGLGLVDLGDHRLRDLTRSEHVFQVVAAELPRHFPPLRTLDNVRHNLPVQRSSFVGRRVELEAVRERIVDGRLVTLTGIGGCGKTRLALEVSATLADRFPDGVFFVDLSLVSDAEMVGQAVASALNLHLLDPGIDGLAGYFRERVALLVLDNCEHLLDAVSDLVDELLARCPDVRVLATSREALGLDGEQGMRVPSLDVDTDALALFVDRARAARPDLRLGADEERSIREICRRLDGIPLAIELAAARASHLTPSDILDRLSDRFALLTGGRRKVQRQRTLAAAVDWSFGLLTSDEQTFLRRLAVFRGSFSLRAAEAICRTDALDLMASLVAKSLVNVDDQPDTTRYRLLETVRVYAEDRLVDSGEAESLRSTHRDWFASWLEGLPVGELVVAGRRVAPEADNLLAALEWSRQQGRTEHLVRIASRMIGYWWTHFRIAEIAGWWHELETSLDELDDPARAAALLVGTQHAMLVGDFVEMERLSGEALTLAPPDSWVAAYAWSMQALHWTYGDPERGRRSIEEGRKAASAAGVPEVEAILISRYANLLTGDAAHDQAHHAEDTFEAVLAKFDDPAFVENLGIYVWLVASILAALGQVDRASRLARTLPPVRTPLDRIAERQVATVIAFRSGDTRLALDRFREMADIVREIAAPLGEEACLVALAAIAVEEGDHERASRLLATVRAAGVFPFRSPLEVLLYRQSARAVAANLDRETIDRCRAEGASMTVSDALTRELARLRALAAEPA